jgi:hypothetical protein
MEHTPSDSNNLFINLLLVFEQKIGFPISSISACHKASDVLSKERVALSGHTIARLFGVLQSKSKPYASTYNIVAQFCGFKDYNQYLTSAHLVRGGAIDAAQYLVNKNNAHLEIALRFAFQTEDAESIHCLLEQVEADPYALWLSNVGKYLYAFPVEKQMRLLEILSKSECGIKYFYEQYVNEDDVHGTYDAALLKFYNRSISQNQNSLFSRLFSFTKSMYHGKRISRTMPDLRYFMECTEKYDLHFHLCSRILEIEVLTSDLQRRTQSQKAILHAFTTRALRKADTLNTIDKTWFYSRLCRAFAFKEVLLLALEHDEFRMEIQQLYEAQRELIYYPGLMILQTVMHFYWKQKGVEHGYVFQLHHPFCTQNETITIKSMEAFGLALYDASMIGTSIKKNLPLTLRQNGQLWMKGLLPVFNS